MRKAILASMFLAVALVAFGQHGGSVIGGKSARKSTAKPKPKATPASKDVSGCGQQIPTFDQYLEEIKIEWRPVIGSEDATIYYNTRKTACDKDGILHVWIKALEKHSQTTLSYSIIRYELKCRTDQYRLMSATGYDSAGRVVNSTNPDNPKWEDAVPDSVVEGVLNHVCRGNL